MKRKTLTGKRIGLVFGTFAPMHTGHIHLIQQAKTENNETLVLVSGTNTERDRGTKVGLPLNRRFRYIREVFRDDELVVVDKLDEEGMPAYPDGWEPWLVELDRLIDKNTNGQFEELTLYVGEAEYVKPLEDHFAERYKGKKKVFVILVERSSIPVSATKIRENPLAYWRYIAKPFRTHFTKKVLIAGAASGGKTTLAKNLGRVYNAPVSLEYAREYQDRYNVRDEELAVNDYVHLLADQYQQTSRILDEGSHSGIVFADTNSSVTMAYIDHYLKDSISQTDYKMLSDLYKSTVAREDWDLILFTLPNTRYVDDGFRDMDFADQAKRDQFTAHLLELLEPWRDRIIFLDGKGDRVFADNYQKAVEAIRERLGIEL